MIHRTFTLSAYALLVTCGSLLGMATVTHPLNRHFRIAAITMAVILLIGAMILLAMGAHL